MKVSRNKIIIWAVAALVVAVVLIEPSTQRGKYSYEIQTISNVCSFDVFPQQNISVSGSSVTIVAPIQTPTPCYDVRGTVNFVGSDIFVNLGIEKKGQTCVECIGTVVAKVTISNLEAGTYNVKVNTPDKSLASEVEIL